MTTERQSLSLPKSIKRSVRKSIGKTPKHALVVLHARTSKGSDDETKAAIDYISLALDLLIFGSFAVIGTIYSVRRSGKNSCSFGVPLFLVAAGYPNVILSVLRFCLPFVGTMAQCAFNLAMCVYGSVLVLGKFSRWQDTSPVELNYCHPLPFLTAFVFVIVTILWFAIVAVAAAIVLLVGLTVGFKPYRDGGDLRTSEQIIVISQSEFKKLAEDVRGETDMVRTIGRKERRRRRSSSPGARASAQMPAEAGGSEPTRAR